MATPWYYELVDSIMLGPGHIPLHMAVELDEARLLEGWRESGPAWQMLMLVALDRDAALAVHVAGLLAQMATDDPQRWIARVARELEREVAMPGVVDLVAMRDEFDRRSNRPSDQCERMAQSAMWNAVHVVAMSRVISVADSLDRQRALLTLTRTASRVLEFCGGGRDISQGEMGEPFAPRSMLEIVAASERWPR
jgi:hypothetical protein